MFRNAGDVFFYTIGDATENELLLCSVLNCLLDSVAIILKGQVDKRTVLENLDYVLLALDEMIDSG